MNSMPGAGGSGGAGGYGGQAGGGMPGGIPGGAQQSGVPVDHQQQQMMMQRQQQQQMVYMQQQQQQQQAAAARGMYPKAGMPQQHPGMMQQQNMYAMQQQQQMDPATMQRYQMAARQQQHVTQQHMLESYRNMSPDERQARQQALQMAQASASRGYPPGMQPAGGNPAMAAGHMGGQPQQPGSSGMGMSVAAGAVSGVIPSHYIKQEPLGGVGGASGTGSMMGGHGGHGSPAQLMNVKQEPSLNVKQEPGVASSMHHPGSMPHQGADDSPQMAMQHMQPINMRLQQTRQVAAMRGMSAQQQQHAAMQGSPGSMVDPSMTVQQALAAKADEARIRQQQAAAAGHPHMQQMQQLPMDPMQQQMLHQRMMYQQQMQQQGMVQMHSQQQQLQQQRQQQMYAATVPSAGSMGPPPSMQQQPLAAASVAGAPLMATSAVLASSDDEDEVKKFKMQVEALKEKYGSVVERIYKRAAADLNMPRFITVCRELFSGERAYSRDNSNTVSTLEKRMDGYLERQSITAGIMLALESMVAEEAKALGNGEGAEKSPSTASVSYASSRILPDPWPLDVRARRVRVPDGLSHHVRSHAMDARLISRRKRHADAMREEEDLPLWSARRMRHECDLDGELEEMDRLEPSADAIIGSPFKIAPEHSLPKPLVNTVLKSEIMEQTLRRKQMGGESQEQLSRLHAKMPQEAMKELSMHRWRMVTDDRLMFTDTTNFMVVIAMGEMAVPPLHVVIPSEYPARPATVLFEKTFPKSHPQLRRLGEAMEARLANVSVSTQGRVNTMAEVYKATCEDFFGISRSSIPSTMPVMLQQQEQSPSPLSFSSSTSTSPADSTVAPPTIPMLHHLPTTYRPPNKFRAIDGNAKSRMVY